MSTDYTRISEIAHDAISLPILKEESDGLVYQKITEQIIGAAFQVHRTLGHGFLEKIYQRSMEIELMKRGLKVTREYPAKVQYEGKEVGEYFCDLFVESCVIAELKVAERYVPQDEAQLLNVLKATGIRIGLLINFGRSKVEFKRFVC